MIDINANFNPGNHVDAALFAASMLLPTGNTILHEFDFDSDDQTSAVVTQNRKSKERLLICKGSFRRIGRLASDNLPRNYFEVAEEQASNGRYVLAIGTRVLKEDEDIKDRGKLIGGGLILHGLLVFANPIKPESVASIDQVLAGGVKSSFGLSCLHSALGSKF